MSGHRDGIFGYRHRDRYGCSGGDGDRSRDGDAEGRISVACGDGVGGEV